MRRSEHPRLRPKTDVGFRSTRTMNPPREPADIPLRDSHQMSTITTPDGVEIFYKDWGQGRPIVFSHGWPLSSDDWDAQMLFFLRHGYRVIAHDRRGHGRSAQVDVGHDLDHYADDLHLSAGRAKAVRPVSQPRR
jgi:alpha-beta hydrolase superfamily lysophospholipase